MKPTIEECYKALKLAVENMRERCCHCDIGVASMSCNCSQRYNEFNEIRKSIDEHYHDFSKGDTYTFSAYLIDKIYEEDK